MALKIWPRLRYIRPFRKARAPPLIVFRDGMKLRKIEGNDPGRYGGGVYLLFAEGNVHIELRVPGKAHVWLGAGNVPGTCALRKFIRYLLEEESEVSSPYKTSGLEGCAQETLAGAAEGHHRQA